MRILSLNYEYPPLGGGAGHVTKAINEKLVEKGFAVDLITMHFKGLPVQETINGVQIFRTKALRKKEETCETLEMASFVASAIPFALKLTKQKKYDLIHCHFAIPTGPVAYWVSRIRNLDYILTCHGSDIPGYNPDRFKLEHACTKPFLKMIMKRAKTTVALSEYLKTLIKENVAPNLPVAVIPNGIDTGLFSVDHQRKNRILMSGRFLQRKGFQFVLNALKDLSLSDWEIHLAGDGPYRKTLEDLAAQSNNKIIFHGWLNRDSAELKELYEHSKIFIMPSDVENAPIALLEAMSAGLAVITTNTTGCYETAGASALLVDPHDEKAIRNATLNLMHDENLIKEFSAKARQRVTDYFQWDRIIDQYIRLYEEASIK